MKIYFKSILLSFFSISIFDRADFVWMIHPLNIDDIYKRYKLLKFLPKSLINFLLKLIPPMVLSEIKNIDGFDGHIKRGYVIGCFITPELMRNNKEMIIKKVFKTAKITKLLKSKLLVIGGMISVSEETEEKINSLYGISLSNGVATMTMVMDERIANIIKKFNLEYSNLTLSVVNAASSKGYLVSNIFSQYNFKKILLFDNNKEKLIKLKNKIKRNVDISTNLNELINSDLIIIAPSYKKLKFENNHLKNGVIIYDVDDPHYNFDKIAEKVKLRAYSNGLVNINKIDYNYNLGIPKDTAYTCLTEAFLLAMANDLGLNYCNRVTLDEVKRVKKYFNKSNLSLSK